MTQPTDVHDLFALDRDVERAARAWRTWRRDLAAAPELHEAEDVFAAVHRRVSGKSLYDALAPGSVPDPAGPLGIKEALRRWIAFLVQARLTRDDDVGLARALAAPEAWLEESRKVSYRDAWHGVLSETTRGKSLAWFDAAASRAKAIEPLYRERRERRAEVLRRLGLSREPRPEVLDQAPALAAALLDATHDLASALLREERKRESLPELHPVDAIRLAMARSAREGWPARLSPRWLRDLFAGWLEGVTQFDLDPLPKALGGASFALTLERFGRSFRTARFESKSALPFVLRSEPHFVDAHRMGALTCGLVASPVFHRRALGLGKDAAKAQARALGITLLFTLRLRAASLHLEGADTATWDELTARLFGSPAPRTFRGAWPHAGDDIAAMLVGQATAPALTRALVADHDEDWFVNPRAFEALRARTLYPARSPEDTLEPSQTARELGRAFEEALA